MHYRPGDMTLNVDSASQIGQKPYTRHPRILCEVEEDTAGQEGGRGGSREEGEERPGSCRQELWYERS